MRGWKHVFYRIKVSFVFHLLRFKSKLHFTNKKSINNCSLMDNIEFLLQLVIVCSLGLATWGSCPDCGAYCFSCEASFLNQRGR